MSDITFNRLSYICIVYLAILNVITGDKFIANVLKQRVSQHIMSTSNNVNHKLWMKYLEKRLEVLNINVAMQDRQINYIFSLLH